ncbi:heterokaryon incompatibility protein-domain-containing protein [Coniochaeta sp. 2T2.1]|nr:heterokaryon incompatibility protein-domain-containing protein [Coniochaeta sp. 2T2.1]
MSEQPKACTYEALPNDTSIRLLRLLSKPGEDPVCSLETFDIDDEVAYDCLSYTWGDPLDHQLSSPSSTSLAETPPGRSVTLDCGYRIDVTPNLFDALHHLSSNGYSTNANTTDAESGRVKNYLWIDALCIDQCSTDEKNRQVSLMGCIYEKAHTVIIWLGHADGYPREILPWSKLMAAAQLLDETHLDTVLKAYILNMLEKPKFRGSIKTKLFDNRLNSQQIFGKLSKMSAQSLNLGQLLYFSRCFNATDPRDHIFAVLGMWDASQSYRGTTYQIKPDYDSPVADVYVHATYMAIYEAENFGMLGVRSGTRSSRWKASDGLLWSRPSTSQWSRSLPVEGLLIDVVEDIGPTYAEIDSEFLLKDLAELARQDTFREQPADNDAARAALVAAAVGKMRDLEVEMETLQNSIPGLSSSPYQAEIDQLKSLHMQTIALLSRLASQPPFDQIISALAARDPLNNRDKDDFDEAFRIAYYGRRLFRTRKGYFGITAQSLHQGDCVWILAGADTPFVLSKLHDDYWRVVVEAYVFGIMNGEVLTEETRLEKLFLR